MQHQQLPLQIRLDDAATFANFYDAGNEELVALLKQNRESCIYFWSSEAAGKTHLLQAVCKANGNRAIYLPLNEINQLSPEMFQGLEQFQVICLDDVQQVAGKAEWEAALFNLYNRSRDSGSLIRVAGTATAGQLSIELPDLVSRLNWGPVFYLQPLSDVLKVEALKMRSGLRGFDMPDEVANYLINHFPRDMHSLFAILDRLDEATLQAKRKLTIPFIKQHLLSV